MTEEDVTAAINTEKSRTKRILSALVKEGFIKKTGEIYRIA
jgi:predicted transcriptional regulator